MDEEKVYLVVGIIITVLLLAGFLISPKLEADAYTKLTGKKVSYWDAAVLDLRAQESIK